MLKLFLIKAFLREMSNGLLNSEYCIFGTNF